MLIVFCADIGTSVGIKPSGSGREDDCFLSKRFGSAKVAGKTEELRLHNKWNRIIASKIKTTSEEIKETTSITYPKISGSLQGWFREVARR